MSGSSPSNVAVFCGPCFSKKIKYLDEIKNFIGKEGNLN